MGNYTHPAMTVAAMDRRRRVTTPRALQESLVQAIAVASKPTPQNNIPSTIRLHSSQSSSEENSTLLSAIRQEHAEQIARTAASAINLLELAVGADPYIRPMLAFYGCEHLLGVKGNLQLEW